MQYADELNYTSSLSRSQYQAYKKQPAVSNNRRPCLLCELDYCVIVSTRIRIYILFKRTHLSCQWIAFAECFQVCLTNKRQKTLNMFKRLILFALTFLRRLSNVTFASSIVSRRCRFATRAAATHNCLAFICIRASCALVATKSFNSASKEEEKRAD